MVCRGGEVVGWCFVGGRRRVVCWWFVGRSGKWLVSGLWARSWWFVGEELVGGLRMT